MVAEAGKKHALIRGIQRSRLIRNLNDIAGIADINVTGSVHGYTSGRRKSGENRHSGGGSGCSGGILQHFALTGIRHIGVAQRVFRNLQWRNEAGTDSGVN